MSVSARHARRRRSQQPSRPPYVPPAPVVPAPIVAPAPRVVPAPMPAPIAPTPAPAPQAITAPPQPVATPALVAPTPAAPPVAPASGSVSPGLDSALAPPSAVVQASGGQSDTSDGRPLRIAGILSASFGVASIATGVIFYIRARSFSDAVTNQKRFNPSYQTVEKTAETLQWVFYCVGGAALAAGVTMYWFGMPSTTTEGHARLEVSPVLWPGAAGITASGTF